MTKPIICPTITTDDPQYARVWVDQLAGFAQRVHFDFADGVFAPSLLMNIVQASWPSGLQVDFHVMYQNPQEHLETIISLQPQLVIVHAEADGDILLLLKKLQKVGIKAGVALLENTAVKQAESLIKQADHVLVFGGKLGFYGGTFRDDLLPKVAEVRAFKPAVEIGWDGGVAVDNVAKLVAAGVNVLNTGGAVHNADNPAIAYQSLVREMAG